MGRYASTNDWGLGAAGCNAINAELVGKSSDLCICCALDIEGCWRHHDGLFCLEVGREYIGFVLVSMGMCGMWVLVGRVGEWDNSGP